MPDKDKIKKLLKHDLSITAQQRVSEQQLNEAAERLIKTAQPTRETLQKIGRDIVGDPNIFATTDIDDIVDILEEP